MIVPSLLQLSSTVMLHPSTFGISIEQLARNKCWHKFLYINDERIKGGVNCFVIKK